MPQTDQNRSTFQSSLDRIKSGLLAVGSSDNLHSWAVQMQKHSHQGAITSGLFLLIKAETAKRALYLTKSINPGDSLPLDGLSIALDATLACGGTVVFSVTSPFSGGVTAVIAGMQGVGCVKSVAELIHHLHSGSSLFSGRMKPVEVAVDTIVTFSTLATLGYSAGATGMRSLMQSLLRRGPQAISKWQQAVAAASVSALGLSAVDAIIEYSKAQTIIRPANQSAFQSVLGNCGLLPTCFDTTPLITPGSMSGIFQNSIP